MLKKLAPDIAVITSVKDKIFASPHSRWEHRKLCVFDLPDWEGDKEQQETQDQWDQDVGGLPSILIASPLEPGKKDYHSRDAEEAAEEIDLVDYLLPGQAS